MKNYLHMNTYKKQQTKYPLYGGKRLELKWKIIIYFSPAKQSEYWNCFI